MVLLATLRRSGGIEAIARHLELPTPVARAAILAMFGEVLRAYRRAYDTAGGGCDGAAHVLRLVERHGGGQMAAAVLSPEPLAATDGDDLVAELFGNRAAALAAVEAGAAAAGLSAPQIALMLGMLAMLVGGYLAARTSSWKSAQGSPEATAVALAEFESLLMEQAGDGEALRGEEPG